MLLVHINEAEVTK